jgi:3-oxoacyl-[acyl-carrier-protein] synthase II
VKVKAAEGRVVVTGIGVVSPIGIGKEPFWEGLISGRNGVTQIESFDTSAFRTHRGGEVKDFRPESYFENGHWRTMGRGAHFSVAAAKMALEDAGVDVTRLDPTRSGVCCGTTMGESQILEQIDDILVHQGPDAVDPELPVRYPAEVIPSSVARYFGLRGPVSMVTTACAAGNYAIGQASDLLRMGLVDLMLAGGSDPLSRIAFTGFNSMLAVAPQRCQPFDLRRKGMCVSEGCAILVLEPLRRAVDRGARIYAEVAACGIGNDAHHMTSPHPKARGAIGAITNALREAQLHPEQVNYISAHGTGTPANDRIETAAIKAVWKETAYQIPVSSIKSMLGHTMGAASAIEATACALMIERGIIAPTINYEERDPDCDLDYVPNTAREWRIDVAVSNSFAFGGNCSALVLKRCEL